MEGASDAARARTVCAGAHGWTDEMVGVSMARLDSRAGTGGLLPRDDDGRADGLHGRRIRAPSGPGFALRGSEDRAGGETGQGLRLSLNPSLRLRSFGPPPGRRGL